MANAKPAKVLQLSGRREGKDSGGRDIKTPPAFVRVAPEPPEWLSEEAAAEWSRVVPGLQRLDLLKAEDRAILVAYCETWSSFVAAIARTKAEGLTIRAAQGMIAHPAVGIARVAGRELRAFALQFGLSPVAEMALGKVSDDEGKGDNPFSGT